MLYLIPTPIGNLEDITLRGLRLLKEVALVLAEDTRNTKKLFIHFGIETPLRSFHAHNEHQVVEQICERLKMGEDIALVSDAGTPGISDPGFLLVRACVRANIEVQCLPGATAFVPALVCSGLPSDTFHFEGFLPQKKGRQTRLLFITELEHTAVLYESPHRLLKLLEELKQLCPDDRQIVVSREISKIYEQHKRGTITEVLAHFQKNPVKGEIVVIIEAAPKKSKKEKLD
jgi:16S rRNA (cytidine1402-2'-O)-methyltransferase